jgi:hypothetical protein
LHLQVFVHAAVAVVAISALPAAAQLSAGEGTSKPDKPWDYMGTRSKSMDFMIHGTSVEIEKGGYLDFKMNFEDIPSVEKAKNSFEVYATLQKK